MNRPTAPKTTAFILMIGLGLLGCTDDSTSDATAESGGKGASEAEAALVESVCRGVSLVKEVGTVTADGLTRPTGLAASRKSKGIWWLTDDGQKGAHVWAIDDSGEVRATVKLKNVKPFAWEDVAVTTDRSGNETVYVADTGDVAGDRKSVSLHSFAAPDLSDSVKGAEPVNEEVDALIQEFTYPDNAHDAKAMFVDPVAGEFYLVTNDPGAEEPPGVYRGKLYEGIDSPGTLAELEPFTTAPVALITAADLSPNGSAVGIRAHGRSGVWQRSGKQAIGEVLAKKGCQAPAITEAQGEGMGFASDGSFYMTISANGTLSKVQPAG